MRGVAASKSTVANEEEDQITSIYNTSRKNARSFESSASLSRNHDGFSATTDTATTGGMLSSIIISQPPNASTENSTRRP
jgi:hypothetical protein